MVLLDTCSYTHSFTAGCALVDTYVCQNFAETKTRSQENWRLHFIYLKVLFSVNYEL